MGWANEPGWEWAEDSERQRFEQENEDMSTIAKDAGGGDFKKVPQGTHMAVCNMVVNLGAQPTSYQGQDTGLKPQVYIRWEIPSQRVEYDDKEGNHIEGPMTVGKTYTISLSEKANLRKDLEAWRNQAFTEEERKGFDVDKVLGKCCQVIVTHKESQNGVFAKVTGIAGWPTGVERITAENDLLSFSADNTSLYEKLPKWIKEKLNGAVTQSAPEQEYADSDVPFDDSIPF